MDSEDVKNGLASIFPFEEFENVDFCITELKHWFVYKVDSIAF